ncbi:MAG: hypothetical protein LBE34_13980 [Flavobacteriaceae bacterium]|jgi:hypothetical protein|nr:hypothetical protein [Flavobacteriaceae bacterium]
MITFKDNFKKILTLLLENKQYNGITKSIINYLKQPSITAFGYFATLDNYSIVNQESIKKSLITLLIDMTKESQKNNFLNTEIIENLQVVKKLFLITDEDFTKYSANEVNNILSLQDSHLQISYAARSIEVENNLSLLRQLFGIEEESYNYNNLMGIQLTYQNSCTTH